MILIRNDFTKQRIAQKKHKNKRKNKQVILISKLRYLTWFIQVPIYRVFGVKEAKNRWDTQIQQEVCKLCQVIAQKLRSHVTTCIYNFLALIAIR